MGFWANLFGVDRPVTEAAPATQPTVDRRGYEPEVPAGGIVTDEQARMESAGRQQTMEQLYQAYLSCPPVSACIDTTARMVTAGGLQLVPDDGEADSDSDRPPAIQQLDALMRTTNPQEDCIQLLRASVADLLTFGDGWIELGSVANIVAAMWSLDGTTMSVKTDDHGQVSGYYQRVDSRRNATFELDEVIHVSLDSPRGGVYGVSPTQKLLVPIQNWLFAAGVLMQYMRQGAPPRLAVDLGADTKPVDAERWAQQFVGRNLGPRNQGKPIVTRVHPAGQGGEPPIKELTTGHVADLLATLTHARDEIVSGFGMTPAMIGIIESGNLGGGTGEAQARTFHYGTVLPIQNLLLEKLNYRLLYRQGITGWKFQFGEVEYRDTAVIEAQRKDRISTGQWTVNRARAEIGEPPVDGGDEAVLILSRNVVAVKDMAASSQASIVKDSGGVLGPDGQPVQPPGDAGSPGGPAQDGDGDGTDPAQQDEPPVNAGQQEAIRTRRDAWAEAYRRQLAAVRAEMTQAQQGNHEPEPLDPDGEPAEIDGPATAAKDAALIPKKVY